MKKLLILLFFCILCVGSVSALYDYCYQETANVSTACGGLNTGSYAYICGPGEEANFYVNYTKPLTSNNYTWMVKHGYNQDEYNITLPNDCINYSNISINLKIRSNRDINPYFYSQPYCYNGTWKKIGNNYNVTLGTPALPVVDFPEKMFDEDWDTFAVCENSFTSKPWSNIGGYHGKYIYEEGMYFYMEVFKTLTMNGTTIYASDADITFDINNPLQFNYNNFTLYNDYIELNNVNYTNPDTINPNLNITTNITIEGIEYETDDLPYISSNTTITNYISSNMIERADIEAVFNFYYGCDNISSVFFNSDNGLYNKFYNESEYICNNSKIYINISDIEKGPNNYLTIFYNYSLYNCSVPGAINFYIYNEDNPDESLTGNVEVFAQYYINSDFVSNFSFKYNDSSEYAICLLEAQPNQSILSDVYFKYETENGFIHKYFLINESINNDDYINVSLYNWNNTDDTAQLDITTRNRNDYGYYINSYGLLQRWYVAENIWRTVQMQQAGEYGEMYFNVLDDGTDYRLIYKNEYGQVLKTTDTLSFSCGLSNCEATQLLDPSDAVSIVNNVDVEWSYDNDTKTLSFYWENVLGLSSNVDIEVYKNTITGEIKICDYSQSAVAGSYDCNVSLYNGEVFVTIKADNTFLVNQWQKLTKFSLSEIIGDNEGTFWTLAIILICVGAGAVSPISGVISIMFCLTVIYWLGIFNPISYTAIIILGSMAITIGVVIRK